MNMTVHGFLLIIFCELPYVVGKDSGVVFGCPLHCLNSDLFPSLRLVTCQESPVFAVVTQRCEKTPHDFPKGICTKANAEVDIRYTTPISAS